MTEIDYRAKVIEIGGNFLGRLSLICPINGEQCANIIATAYAMGGDPLASLSTVTRAEFGETCQRQMINACSTEDQLQVVEQAVAQTTLTDHSFIHATSCYFHFLGYQQVASRLKSLNEPREILPVLREQLRKPKGLTTADAKRQMQNQSSLGPKSAL